ncbi:MAG TPA: phage major capsid protein, partial [Candidatus Flavonifractor intestinipullorum]|nr:phage major capsid protein [Candidatus Flavonifractor intestinipullorum]
GTLSYDALLDFWAQFDPYTMNTMLVGGDTMLKLLKLDELQNPLTGLNFQGTGTLTTPLGATLLRTSAVPAGKLIGLDKHYALEMVSSGDVLVEYDKLIDRQLERAAITSISGFAKLYQDASKVLTI